MEKIKTAALIGLGALGILYAQNMPNLQVIVDEERLARYKAEPVTANGRELHFDYVTPAEGKPVDFLMIATKTTHLDAVIPAIQNFVGENTVILCILNGITSEERLEAFYPGHLLYSLAIYTDATRIGRTLTYDHAGEIDFGEKNGEITERVRAVSEYLTRSGVKNVPCTDILYRQWHKLMINVGLNQTCAVFDLTYGGLNASAEAQRYLHGAMDEVIAVANAEGVALPKDAGREWFGRVGAAFNGDGCPSMRQDVMAKRSTEVEEFSGTIRRLGRKHGIATPYNDFFYEKIAEIERDY